MTELLSDVREYLVIAHVFGVVLGLGGAVVTDFLFLRFLKDFRVSKEEKEVLDGLSLIIWGGYGLLVLTGLLLFWPYKSALLATPVFQVKMIVVAVILVNGLFLNFYVSPKLTSIAFDQPGLNTPQANRIRKISPVFGGISMVSWLSAFFLGSVSRSLDQSFAVIFGAYLALLLAGITITTTVTRIKFRPKKLTEKQ